MSSNGDIKSRDQFVIQVVQSIEKSFGINSDEAFIFGISGKWGEGKSTFLKSLEDNFSQNVKVIQVNPWKYADDKISFLRTFLKELSNIVPYSEFIDEKHPKIIPIRDKYWEITAPLRARKLRPLYDDVSKNKIQYIRLSLVIVAIAIFAFIYQLFATKEFKDLVIENKWFITVLLVPVVLAAGKALITSQKSYHSITTLDDFDSLITRILKKLSKNTFVVVFVDDLDRVTGQKAVEVLDNLRTFFDKSALAFIVAGDHIVIERHLGKQLLPDSTSPADQKEEGRRFLKKIFNVYWRLPLPTQPELKEFIQTKVLAKNTDSGAILRKVFKDEVMLSTFATQLETYFDNNFRNILRFVDRVAFSFQVINSQINNPDIESAKKKYFREMRKNPLLVVRVLLLEELVNPLYEKVLTKPALFSDLEIMQVKGMVTRVDHTIESLDMIGPQQRAYLKTLLADEPKFFGKTGVRVMSLMPYLYLSSDSSFGDERGLSAKDFIARIKEGDTEEVKAIIEQSGDEKSTAAATEIRRILDKEEDPDLSTSLTTTLFKALSTVSPDFNSHAIFLSKFSPGTVGDIMDLPESEQKVSILMAYTDWLETIRGKQTVELDLALLTTNLTEKDIDTISGESFNYELSSVICHWFVKTFNESPTTEALDHFEDRLPAINGDALVETIPLVADSLVEDVFTEIGSTHGELELNLITNYAPSNTKANLKQKATQRILESDESVWPWVRNNLGQHNIFSDVELDNLLLEIVKGSIDSTTLYQTLLFVSDKLRYADQLWEYLLAQRKDDLVAALPSMYNQTRLLPIAPSSEHAKTFFELVYGRKKNTTDENLYLQYLRKSEWYFTHLVRLPYRASITPRARSSTANATTTSELNRILQEWPNK